MSDQATPKQIPIKATEPKAPPTSYLSCLLSEESLAAIRTLPNYLGDLQTLVSTDEATTRFYSPKITTRMRSLFRIR